jgi:ribose transport system substrate-binding protein
MAAAGKTRESSQGKETTVKKLWIVAGVAAVLSAGSQAPAMAQDQLEQARAVVEEYSRPNPPWDGPTTGPAAEQDKLVVYVSTDQRNGGARGVGEGVVEAAETLGWEHRTIDGQGTVSGRSSGLTQAIALQPDAIVLGGIDATEQAALIQQAADAGIAVVGWHSYAATGPHPQLPVFTNITTDPLKVAEAAGSYAVVTSNGEAGAIIFTDSVYEIAIAKSDAMAAVIRACSPTPRPGCRR